MIKESTRMKVADLDPNEGQLGWLPKNPRQWTKEDIDRTKRSIQEDPDFLEDRPLLVCPGPSGRYVVFGGNLRLTAARALKMKDVPVICYNLDVMGPEEDTIRETIKRRAMKDNGSFGSWDFDQLANEWDDLPLPDWGVPSWDKSTRMELSTRGREGGEGYDEFVDKFKQKLTTDDCYTPQPVYDAILKWVRENIPGVNPAKIVRPFFPGGDYTKTDQYPDGCFVLDNPPFSILADIVRFYCEHGIRFFIFAPSLTLFTARGSDVTYIVTDSDIEYENGAKVRTGFITNALEGVRVWLCPELSDAVEEAQADEDKTKQGFVYPDNIITAAILGKIVKRGISLKIRKESCEPISESDSAKEQGRGLYGGGFIISDGAAAERAAAERAAVTRLLLSPREKGIIERLNAADDKFYHYAEKGPETQN